MKFQPDRTAAFTIRSYSAEWFRIEGEQGGELVQKELPHSLLLDSQSGYSDWACSHYNALSEQNFESLLSYQPELVLFGSGSRLRFPKAEWIRPLIQARVGVESMDTAAACRTYNILAAEGRRVLGVFLLPNDDT